MIYKSVMGVVGAGLLAASFNASAMPVSVDWQSAGDGLITFDAASGLEWLDLTYTTNRSYNDISSKFGAGLEFEGWRYANSGELAGLWTEFGGNGSYTGWSSANNGLVDTITALMGETWCLSSPCAQNGRGSQGILADSNGTYANFYAYMYDSDGTSTLDLLSNRWGTVSTAAEFARYGSYLVRESAPGSVPVPEPSIAVLMASALIAFGAVKRKSRGQGTPC